MPIDADHCWEQQTMLTKQQFKMTDNTVLNCPWLGRTGDADADVGHGVERPLTLQ